MSVGLLKEGGGEISPFAEEKHFSDISLNFIHFKTFIYNIIHWWSPIASKLYLSV